jgi:hypothetical protein
VVEYHNGSMSQALMDLFPNIGLEKSRLKPQCESFTTPFFSSSLPLSSPVSSPSTPLLSSLYSILLSPPLYSPVSIMLILFLVFYFHFKCLSSLFIDLFAFLLTDEWEHEKSRIRTIRNIFQFSSFSFNFTFEEDEKTKRDI